MPIAKLAVVGVRGPADTEAIEAALHARDPAATISASWADGGLDVDSAVSAAELCAAIQDAGFIAAPVRRTPIHLGVGDVFRLFGRSVLFAILAGIGGAILGIAVGIANLLVNPECNSGGDEGACAMGIPTIGFGFAAIGMIAGGALTLGRGLWRKLRT